MKRSFPAFLASVTLVAGFLALGGCNGNRLTVGEIRRNPTPELDHTARSTGQVRNDHARILDSHGRMFWDDLERLLLVDRNRTTSPYIAPNY